MDTHTDVDEEQSQAEEPGLSDHMGGKVQRDVCLDAAIYGQCTDEQCWRKHDAESIEQFKAALGTKRWEKKKQWWKRIRAEQKPSTPKADDTDEAEISKGSEHKGAKKGNMYMLYGDSARGQGGSHLTLTARAPHARMTQALARFERACGAIGRAAVKLAEEVDACIEFELTRRRVGFYKDMPSEQSIEQPTDMPIMPREQPTDMPMKQPTGRPKEQSIDVGHGKVKPNMIEMATLEGAHSVFKGIKNGHMQTKRASVATSRRRHARASFGSGRTHRSI